MLKKDVTSRHFVLRNIIIAFGQGHNFSCKKGDTVHFVFYLEMIFCLFSTRFKGSSVYVEIYATGPFYLFFFIYKKISVFMVICHSSEQVY